MEFKPATIKIFGAGTFLMVTLIMTGLAQAQEFWMQPDRFTCSPGENLIVTLKAGENLMGETEDIEPAQIQHLTLKQLGATRDLAGVLKSINKGVLEIPMAREGTHLLLMEHKNELITWEGEDFDARLKAAGLDEIYDQRRRTNSLGKVVREFASRETVLIVQVGRQTDNTYKDETEYPLEIIPSRNPYSLRKGDPIGFRVLFEGKPLFGAKVRIWNRFDNRTTIQNIYTEQSGIMETHISNPGAWMVSVTTMEPADTADAEWQSFQTTLVFGIE